jgi:hypothetical protein
MTDEAEGSQAKPWGKGPRCPTSGLSFVRAIRSKETAHVIEVYKEKGFVEREQLEATEECWRRWGLEVRVVDSPGLG